MGYNVGTLFNDFDHVDSLQSVLDMLFEYYAWPIHTLYALSRMRVIEEVDVTRDNWNNEEKIRNEVMIAWSRLKHNFDDDELNILRI